MVLRQGETFGWLPRKFPKMHCAVASAIITKHKIASIETMFQLSDSRVMGPAPQTCKNLMNRAQTNFTGHLGVIISY